MNQKGSVAVVLLVGVVIILSGALGYTLLMQQAAKSDAVILPQDDSDIFKPTSPQPKAAQATKPPQPAPSTSNDVTLDDVLNTAGFVNGERRGSEEGRLPVEKVGPEGVVFGDIDADGTKEAVASVFWCHASCGTIINVYKKVGSKMLMANLPDAGGKSVESISIKDGAIVVTRAKLMGSPLDTVSYNVTFVNSELHVLEEPSTAPLLTVISPNGGETFKIGQSIQIQWDPAQPSVFVSLVGDPAQPYCLSPNQNYEQSLHGDASGESINVIASSKFTDGNTCRFKVKVQSNANASATDQSDSYFTVTQ